MQDYLNANYYSKPVQNIPPAQPRTAVKKSPPAKRAANWLLAVRIGKASLAAIALCSVLFFGQKAVADYTASHLNKYLQSGEGRPLKVKFTELCEKSVKAHCFVPGKCVEGMLKPDQAIDIKVEVLNGALVCADCVNNAEKMDLINSVNFFCASDSQINTRKICGEIDLGLPANLTEQERGILKWYKISRLDLNETSFKVNLMFWPY